MELSMDLVKDKKKDKKKIKIKNYRTSKSHLKTNAAFARAPSVAIISPWRLTHLKRWKILTSYSGRYHTIKLKFTKMKVAGI